MSERIIQDFISDGHYYHPIITEMDAIVDVLDRQSFISNVFQLINQISLLKGSGTIAINGEWGSGKTYVLKQIERQLSAYQDGKRFLVIHYNCWQYDYYEEPLVAIVSSVKESLQEQLGFFSNETKQKIKQAIGFLGDVIAGITMTFPDPLLQGSVYTGMMLYSEATKAVSRAKSNSKDNQYDRLKTFSTVLGALKESIKTITQEVSIVFAVDEIDRCIPHYAIKVLERLHHLFSDLPNSVVLLTEDKEQLSSVVEQVFGSKRPDEYLRKFINYSFDLDKGKVNNSFLEKYQRFFSGFISCPYDMRFDMSAFCSAAFSGIPIRRQEQLMDSLEKVHNMLFHETEKDYLFLCLELLLLIFSKHYGLTSNPFRVDNNGYIQVLGTNSELDEYFHNTFIGTLITPIYSPLEKKQKHHYMFSRITNLDELIICFMSHFYSDSAYIIQYPKDCQEKYCKNTIEEMKKVDSLLTLLQ